MKMLQGSCTEIKKILELQDWNVFAACAYSQFLNNGLKLGERKKFELAAFDIGNLYHSAIK
ncbi:hypothetical protein OBE_10234, partial [human gut metagenome]